MFTIISVSNFAKSNFYTKSRDPAVQITCTKIDGLTIVSLKAAAWGHQCGVRLGKTSNTLRGKHSDFSVSGNTLPF